MKKGADQCRLRVEAKKVIHSQTFLDFLVLIGASTAFATICYYLKLPTILGFIFGGFVVGPYGFAVVNSIPGAKSLTEIGVVFLMFTIGLEFSRSHLVHLRVPFLKLGIPQLVLSIGGFFAVLFFVMKYGAAQSIFLASLLSLSSTAILMKLLQDARENASPHGNAIIGILLAQDLAVIPIMLALPLLAAAGGMGAAPDFVLNWSSVGQWFAHFAIVALLLALLAKYLVPLALEKVVNTRSRELFLFAVLFICFGIAALTEVAGLSLSFGAFIAGLLLAESPYGRQITADIVPFRDNFLGIFFASVGMLVSPEFIFTHLHWLLLALVLLFLVKSFLLWVWARLVGFTSSTSKLSCLLIFQVGEFSFVLADQGNRVGLLDQQSLQFFLSVSVLSMVMTPFLFKYLGREPRGLFSTLARLGAQSFQVPLPGMTQGPESLITKAPQSLAGSAISRIKGARATSASKTILIGYGVAGQSVASSFLTLKIPYSVIDLNAQSISQLRKAGVDAHFGDASHTEVLEAAGIDEARLVIVVVSSSTGALRIAQAVRQLRPDLRIIIRTQFSREVENYKEIERTDLVVSEFETSIEILMRALVVYGVEPQEISRLMREARHSFGVENHELSDILRNKFDLPAWQTAAAIFPFRVDPRSELVGKAPADGELREAYGVSIVAAFREGFGVLVPDLNFTIQVNDILYVAGTPESIAGWRARAD